MSADNCLAILRTSDGLIRVANIHMIWANEPNRVERLMSWAEEFNFSPVFSDSPADFAEDDVSSTEALENYVDQQFEMAHQGGAVLLPSGRKEALASDAGRL